MMKRFSLLMAMAAVSVFSIGCEKPTGGTTGTPPPPAGGVDDHAGHDHAAADHAAPHGGHLIELGRNHEYHAELLDDHKTESITIYIMDGDMKPLAIKETAVSLALTAGGKTETFEIPASQPDGSSEFKSSDEKMMGLMETEGVTGKLRVTIDGKPFSGSFDHHDHGHAEESHAGHSHD